MKKRSILIVEDEFVFSFYLKSYLEARGYDIPGVSTSGEEAIELAEKLNPDLILMDIVLTGEMDGIQTSAVIKEKFNIPTVFMSACFDNKTIEKAAVVSPFGLLSKPVDNRVLETTIMQVFSQLEREKNNLVS